MEWVFVIFGLRYWPLLTIGFLMFCSGNKVVMFFGGLLLIVNLLKNYKNE